MSPAVEVAILRLLEIGLDLKLLEHPLDVGPEVTLHVVQLGLHAAGGVVVARFDAVHMALLHAQRFVLRLQGGRQIVHLALHAGGLAAGAHQAVVH
eukprot:CAMPEP_0114649712 /NCGR_PEP_ID=MMETSP0191-20121206/7226_1 /TAXON_ID=126664 /ORGANISM="Sorites sp." /LENGTH=95 /DNA_ID=CAMNT_0001863417 /DNA_START=188 /DNA_END=473 /DNA_ORIENTATION=+